MFYTNIIFCVFFKNRSFTIKTEFSEQVPAAKENNVTKRTKHIDTRYHVIREHVSDGIVKIVFVWSENNVADVFTKNVTQDIFLKHGEHLIVNVGQEKKD